jgi:hypothetical protein
MPCFLIAARRAVIDEKMANLLVKRPKRLSPELYPRVSALNIFDISGAFKGKRPLARVSARTELPY